MNLLNLLLAVKSRLKPVFGIYFVSTVLAFSQSVPNKHVITHEDVWLMKRVGAPVPSPDGKWVVFSVVEPAYNEKERPLRVASSYDLPGRATQATQRSASEEPMKIYEIPAGGRSVDALRRAERPDPKPGPGQIVMRVRAASLNFRDQAVITGNYFGGVVQRDTIPLSDGAGEVAAVGTGVTRVKVGDRVAVTFFLGWSDGPPNRLYPSRGAPPVDGMLAECVVVDEQDAVPIPPGLSYEEAATLPCAGVTTWHALVETCRVRPGDTVLVLGTGGVSTFGLQFGRAAGARVIVTSSSDD